MALLPNYSLPNRKKYKFATHSEVGSFFDFFLFSFHGDEIFFQILKNILLREIKGIGECGLGLFGKMILSVKNKYF